MTGKLIIVPTPIGNLGDMTARALEALRTSDVVCAEDTRVTGKLLLAFGIEKRVERLDETLMARRAEGVVQRVRDGEVIAYCSDAGMPGVSDPGLRLVRAAREAGVAVEVLPGPTAAATAYVASGCTNPRFFFGGFFPRKDAERTAALEAVRALDAALIFYESPNRLVDALDCIADVLPLRCVSVCRELTKLHEEVVSGVSGQVRDEFRARETSAATGKGAGIKGEIVIVIDGQSEAERVSDADAATEAARVRAHQLADAGMRKKQIARALVDEFGIARNDAYAIALEA
ncbi:16S rRNA (cytidine(1402)-2'-O)-methyltransferase [Adlercreutzia sp. ZJ141]|uniref:16S rRNA (cytidine(1402)-2'-O)-methyltransferase n=1 Tax=Adlercreutzia sp. ZJ141 TaxID=2709406 RepID=UPI0013EBCC25|nr:16S rRNA (cytidine(1402)-2'-O)-methyltransferase [Adlercreutzia sp. ZJ141]